MATCKFINTVHPEHTCDAGCCQSVAECSAKKVIYHNSKGPDITRVNYTREQ